MQEAAKRLEFERAAELRDRIRYLRGILYGEVTQNGQGKVAQTVLPAGQKRRKR